MVLSRAVPPAPYVSVTKSGPRPFSSRTLPRKPSRSPGALGRKNSNEKTGRPLPKSAGMSADTAALYITTSAFAIGEARLRLVDQLLVLLHQGGVAVEIARR